jgi:asparagine synthase (glutamine-hydrolysing)
MCGIAGRFHPMALPEAGDWHERASALLAHRGPDGAGHFRDACCELVHRRLALIDLSPGGHQPMPNEDGSIRVVFNGEIYNFRELKHELQSRGHGFAGGSDTEVLVHLYEELGEHMVDRLRGIFAFAIYDQSRRRLFLARDRYGVKPLFYAQLGDHWVFASEIKAITALPGFRPALDRQACYDFLGLGWVPEPATGFKEIAALPGGTTLRIDPEGARRRHYDRVTARADTDRTLEESARELESRLEAAVARQSFADVPVAALLSGGIDSSLVVAAHRRTSEAPTLTFNVRFPDPQHDETALARTVADHCGTRHHIIDPADHRLTTDSVLNLFAHFDQPFADTSLIPMYWVSAAVRERGIICALSGDGGDEAFGGYARFWRAARLHRLMTAPGWALYAARMTGNALAGVTRDFGRQLGKAARMANEGRQNTAALLSAFANYVSEDEKHRLVDAAAREGLLPSAYHFDGYEPAAARTIEELSGRMTEKLFALSLPSDMLRKVDMMSMRASIEVRVPLLDEDLVGFGLALPHRLKTDGRQGKLVLRELARRWLPGSVAAGPKHGFTIPLDVMASPSLHTALADLLASENARTRTFINPAMVRHWLDAFAAASKKPRGGAISRGGLYQRVFTLLSLETWMRDHGLTW